MKYQIAKEKYEHITIIKVISSNCKDKVNGHNYEWIFKTNPEYANIIKQLPKLKGLAIVRCTKCNKVKNSM